MPLAPCLIFLQYHGRIEPTSYQDVYNALQSIVELELFLACDTMGPASMISILLLAGYLMSRYEHETESSAVEARFPSDQCCREFVSRLGENSRHELLVLAVDQDVQGTCERGMVIASGQRAGGAISLQSPWMAVLT